LIDEGLSVLFNFGLFMDLGVNDLLWVVDVDWGDGGLYMIFNVIIVGMIVVKLYMYVDGLNIYIVKVKVIDKDIGSNIV